MSQLCPNSEAPSRTLALLDPPPAASPNLTQLLTNNEPPLESEVPFIHKAIADAQGRIQPLDEKIRSLEAQIHDLQAALSQLQNRRDEVAESVRRHQSVISSIRGVPAELICEIFLLASSGASKPPWYLGHICRPWRRYALSYPALWLSVTVDSRLSWELSRLRAQLLRTTNAPLDIQWQCADYHPQVLDLLLPHSSRWRNLQFEDCGLEDFDWLHSVEGCLDRLRRVEVYSPAAEIDIPDVFLTARNLREVILTHHSFSKSAYIAIPWRQITHYHGTYSPARQIEILRAAAPALSECAIGFTSDEFDNETPPIVTLLNLRRLSSQYVAILPLLTAPILEELRLFLLSETISAVGPFIRRSSCTLTRLALIECHIDSELVSLLGALSTLTSLLLDLEEDEEEIDTDWITAMSISGATSDICPHLTTLELGYQHATAVPRHLFFAMARSRFQKYSSSHCRLSRLRLFGLSSDTVAAHIEILRHDGFDVALLDHEEIDKTLF
ncbi:hypothetical protein C8R47DRAFT_1328223 [Mycena vitilis]|nr:hypothetical protein C8R47DRAFT_443413 [Mycena vitilis]KAJ6458391.1 hypothetical protein C8R47DRAFT_1328223 [Mycena vitilis]